MILFFFCKQKTAYEVRISDWSSDVCSSDLQYEQQQNDARVLQLKGPANRRTARPQREQRSAQRQAGQHNACRIGKSIAPNDMFITPRLGQLECLETQNRKNAGHDIEQKQKEERSVGKAGASTGRSRGSQDH